MVKIDEVVPKTNPTTCVAVFLDEGSGIVSFAPGDTVLNLLREVQVKVLAGSCQVSQDSATKARQADDRFTLPKGKPKITVAAGTMCVWLTRNPDHNGGNHPKPIKSS